MFTMAILLLCSKPNRTHMQCDFHESLNYLRVRIVCAFFYMQKIEVGRSSYFINDRKQGDLPLNTLILIALKVECILFYVRFFSSKNGKFGTFSS